MEELKELVWCMNWWGGSGGLHVEVSLMMKMTAGWGGGRIPTPHSRPEAKEGHN